MSITDRERALAYFERELRLAKRLNEDDKEYVQEAVNALRRSLDHTAIQTKLNVAMSCLRELYRVQPPPCIQTDFWLKVGRLLGEPQSDRRAVK
jgi:hypothetical protein